VKLAGHQITAFFEHVLRLWSLICVFGLRHGSLLVALPICSSACFLGLRFLMSVLGVVS